jgi:hypothetical protein
MKVFRQGDVILIPSTRQPSAQAQRVIDHGRTILAYGEVTGHAHEVVTVAPGEVPVDDEVPAQELFQEPDGSRLLVCRVPCEVRHQEHAPIALDATTYEVRRQTEWSLDQARQVAD